MSRQSLSRRPLATVRPVEGGLYVESAGHPDSPVLLLLHGTAGSTRWWDQIVPPLAERYHVVRVDLPGHGHSAPPIGDYGVASQARRVFEALAQCGVHRATVIGHSSGGYVATALAEQYPGFAPAVVLINTGSESAAYIPQNPVATKLLQSRRIGSLLWRMRTDAMIRKGLDTAFAAGVPIPDVIVDGVRGLAHDTFTATAAEHLNYIEQQPLPDRLAILGLPVLVVFGAEDRRWQVARAMRYRDVPGVRLELLPGIGHTPMIEDPVMTVNHLIAFLDGANKRGQLP